MSFDLKKYLAEGRLFEEENFVNVGMEEIEKMAFPIISAYNEQNGLDPIQSIRVTSSKNNKIRHKAIQANITAETNTGKLMGYELTWDNDLNLQKLTPPYKNTDIPQPIQKQKEELKPIFLTPIQKKSFKSAIRDLSKMEDFEYALGEAGTVLANILTNGKAEFIEDVEDFGYDADEVEQYAMDLASE